jgi:muconolactone D-isomerase
MLFLVQIEVNLDPGMAAEDRSALLEAERRRGEELKSEGLIVDIWRIPGRVANYGLWRAPSPSVLHEALTSLPVFPFTRIEVTALAAHHLTTDPSQVA